MVGGFDNEMQLLPNQPLEISPLSLFVRKKKKIIKKNKKTAIEERRKAAVSCPRVSRVRLITLQILRIKWPGNI